MTKKQQLSALAGFIVGFLVALISIGLTNQTPHMKEHNQSDMHPGHAEHNNLYE